MASLGDDAMVITNQTSCGGGQPHGEVTILDDGRRIETADDVRALVAEFLASQSALANQATQN